jgi:CxxC motif-containing protein (DUF1111 family)
MARLLALAAACLVMASACASNSTDLLEPASGGETTTPLANRNAFGSAAPNLSTEERRTFEVGDSFFTQPWVTAPASAEARDGLGPLLNARSCSSCHVLDGRGRPPVEGDDPERGLLLRIGLWDDGIVVPDPDLGDQLQDRSIEGVPAEGNMQIAYTEVRGEYADGTTFSLRQPTYGVSDGDGTPVDNLLISPRIAPVVSGVGLIEAIPEASILEYEDPEDTNEDGITGRANFVVSSASGEIELGRLGWKANVASVEDQVAGAFLGDIGITSPVHPDENCTVAQLECRAAPTGGSPEITAERLAKVVFYSSTLAVPQRRNLDDPDVVAGADLFDSLQCSLCHRPSFVTEDHDITPVSNQTIFPFSDLLLHDMGDGLADGKPDGLATGSEWRTPPLWGIGLVEEVNGHTFFLHDGRARSLEEAVLWHGGEAQASRDSFIALDAQDRSRLISFLESL